MKNAMELRTRRASGVFGRLIREWTVEFDNTIPHDRETDGRLIIEVETLRGILTDNGLVEGDADSEDGDYHIRDDIQQIELIPRRPNRFSVLLPERDVLRSLQGQSGGELRMPAVYSEVDATSGTLQLDQLAEEGPAAYVVSLEGEDKFRKFLDPYMASYLCTQCL